MGHRMINHIANDDPGQNTNPGPDGNFHHRFTDPVAGPFAQQFGLKQHRSGKDRQHQPVIQTAFDVNALTHRIGDFFVFENRLAKGRIGRADNQGQNKGGQNANRWINPDDKRPCHPDGQRQSDQKQPVGKAQCRAFLAVIKHGGIEKQNNRQRHFGKAGGEMNAISQRGQWRFVPDTKWQGNHRPGKHHHHRR